MTDKTKAQLKAELADLKAQLKVQEITSTPADAKGDYRDKMISRFTAIHKAIPRKGVTEDGFIALVMQTVGGITEDTAKKYIVRMKNCGFVSLKTIDLGRWKKEIVKDEDGNESTRITRDGETTVDHGETVWRTEERIFAHPRAQPSPSTLSDTELNGL